MYPSEKRRIEMIAENAAAAFKDHVVTQTLSAGLYRHWQCRRPGTGFYAFNVTTIPWRLFVTGDIGFMAWEREEDMIDRWARQAIDSIDYFEGKVIRDVRSREWCHDAARDWIDAEIAEYREEASLEDTPDARLRKIVRYIEKLQEVKENHLYLGEGHFNEAVFDAGLADGGDWPRLKTYTTSFLWCREALKWLLAKVPARPIKEDQR